MTTLGFLQAVADWLLADPSHIAVAAAVLAAVTPTPNPDSLAGKFYRIVDLLAFNFLHAKESGVAVPQHVDLEALALTLAKALAAQPAPAAAVSEATPANPPPVQPEQKA